MTKQVWSDGLHYVRAATAKDRHPMRWVIKNVRAAETTTNRHSPSKDEAIAEARRLTQEAVAVSDRDRERVEMFKTAATIPVKQDDAAAPKQKRPAGPLPRFATTHFVCTGANPVAQLWKCVSLPGERAPVGRKAKGRAEPKQAVFNHTKGEFAVLRWAEPVRDLDGSVRVFPTWNAAEHYAEGLYYEEPEDERLSWQPDDKVVYSTLNIEVIFDPAVNGVHRPFSLFIPRYNKPVYAPGRRKTYVTDMKNADGSSFNPSSLAEKEAVAFNKKVMALAHEEERDLTMEVLRFKTIWQAFDHAAELEASHFYSTIKYER